MGFDGAWGYVGTTDMQGYAGYVVGDDGYVGDMRDGPPPQNRPGRAAVFGPVPRSAKDRKQERQTTSNPKKNAYFTFNLLIVNHINQYFNIRLHLIRFITYNRRIFIAKYLFDNKTYSIFALVR